MQFDEIHFIEMANRQFFADTSTQEDLEIDFWIENEPRAEKIYSIIYNYYFGADNAQNVANGPKLAEIKALVEKGDRRTIRRRWLGIIIVIFLAALLFTSWHLYRNSR